MNKRLISEFYLTVATSGDQVAHAGRPAVSSGKGYPGSYTTACGLELDPIPVYEVLQHVTCPTCAQLLYGSIVDKVRPEVAAFAQLMELKLRKARRRLGHRLEELGPVCGFGTTAD